MRHPPSGLPRRRASTGDASPDGWAVVKVGAGCALDGGLTSSCSSCSIPNAKLTKLWPLD